MTHADATSLKNDGGAVDAPRVMIELSRRVVARIQQMVGERGATAIEYAMLIALIAALIIGVVGAIGTATGFGFGSFNENFDDARP